MLSFEQSAAASTEAPRPTSGARADAGVPLVPVTARAAAYGSATTAVTRKRDPLVEQPAAGAIVDGTAPQPG